MIPTLSVALVTQLASLFTLYTSPQYCEEMQFDLLKAVGGDFAAIEEQIITHEEMHQIHDRCLNTYTKGP